MDRGDDLVAALDFSQHKVRYLEDPKQVLGGADEIRALGRKGFSAAFPKAAAFVRNMKLPLSELEAVLLKARDSSAAKEAAVFVNTHGEVVDCATQSGWPCQPLFI
jgi:glycine betaine/proline transport system substrate-binding protein